MPTVAKEAQQTLLNALATLGREDYRENVARLLASESTPFVRVYLALREEGFLSRKQLRQKFPDLSSDTLDRATQALIGQYLVKPQSKGREKLYWPRPLRTNRVEKELESQDEIERVGPVAEEARLIQWLKWYEPLPPSSVKDADAFYFYSKPLSFAKKLLTRLAKEVNGPHFEPQWRTLKGMLHRETLRLLIEPIRYKQHRSTIEIYGFRRRPTTSL